MSCSGGRSGPLPTCRRVLWLWNQLAQSTQPLHIVSPPVARDFALGVCEVAAGCGPCQHSRMAAQWPRANPPAPLPSCSLSACGTPRSTLQPASHPCLFLLSACTSNQAGLESTQPCTPLAFPLPHHSWCPSVTLQTCLPGGWQSDTLLPPPPPTAGHGAAVCGAVGGEAVPLLPPAGALHVRPGGGGQQARGAGRLPPGPPPGGCLPLGPGGALRGQQGRFSLWSAHPLGGWEAGWLGAHRPCS
jgi:hypothetical protein